MKKLLLLLFISSTVCYTQSYYETKTGVTYKIGDTIRMGQPLSHLGWISINSNTNNKYVINKNLINKDVIIKYIDTVNASVNFTFTFYNKDFRININNALRNKEVIPQFERELANKGLSSNKYQMIKTLKELLDSGALTKEEFELEKSKILNKN
jgi:Short C-terminal domain